ncbi:MAG: signal transduction protein [Crocinitomicaceae bacterium]|nr:signal transduction protein [Crocinitomicaceae bacterium]|tara:strand:+ start:1391 stop:3280 length:1890 start_codon:yes stop_codon:yes gene_type:complete
MGQQKIRANSTLKERTHFLKHLLNDVEALDQMLKNGLIESGVKRIGAEQEFCIVDEHFRPSIKGPDILNNIEDNHFTSELARYNLEINLEPQKLEGHCFSEMEKRLRKFLNKADDVCDDFNSRVILTGILPSIGKEQVGMDYMTPNPRYYALGDIIKAIRGADFELNIIGVDELILSHSNILFEACNTSFQIHLQISPEEFVDKYNWAQMITGPVLAACTNSPLLFGRQLWSETRIALFQQSIDMRTKGKHLREKQQRVSFGSKWIKEITEIYKDDISRYTLLLTTEIEKDSLESLNNGEIPNLNALNLHNGTIWKWNRPCYGLSEGKAHLRIENRYIPSGPTIIDEMANLAFWIGLMEGMPDYVRGNWHNYQFEAAKENFYKAATTGVQAGIVWDDKLYSTKDLTLEVLIPLCKNGLRKCNVLEKDIDRYMGVIEGRVTSGLTGSRWLVKSYRRLNKQLGREDAMIALTHALHTRRLSKKPVHTWKLASAKEVKKIKISHENVSNIMKTNLFTVKEDDLVELVEKIMEWRSIRHVPVEDNHGKLLGLITKKTIEKQKNNGKYKKLCCAGEIMVTDLVTIKPEMDIKMAMLKMIDKKVGCLPVVDNGELVGILTEVDMKIMWEKLEANE